MDANTQENKKGWFRALISCVVQFLRLEFPLWLYLVAFLACVLFVSVVGCTASKSSVQTALVGVTEYRGHSFLVFRAINSNEGSFSVVHDPDCKCQFVELVDNLTEAYGSY